MMRTSQEMFAMGGIMNFGDALLNALHFCAFNTLMLASPDKTVLTLPTRIGNARARNAGDTASTRTRVQGVATPAIA